MKMMKRVNDAVTVLADWLWPTAWNPDVRYALTGMAVGGFFLLALVLAV